MRGSTDCGDFDLSKARLLVSAFRDEPNGWLPRGLRYLTIGFLSFVVLLIVAGVTLTGRGRSAMKQSDLAFHQGEKRKAVVAAREAALAYVPGAPHVARAHARIEAVARGAETEGDLALARFSWDTLRAVHLETDYPGRVAPPGLARARAGLERLKVP